MPSPKRLWHYTTLAGLHGIFKTRSLWATDILYLNDASEFTYAVELCKTVLETLDAETQELLAPALEPINRGLGWHLPFRVCVASFSEHPDLLSQWRAYSGSGGFSIGFERTLMATLAPSLKLRLEPCIYDRDEQERLLRSLLTDVMNLPDETPDPRRQRQLHCTRRLASLAPTLKDPAFEEEKEWRLVTRLLRSDYPKTEYRPGRSMLLPFVSIPLAGPRIKKLPITYVQLGPTPHPDLAWLAANEFLSSRIAGTGGPIPMYAWPPSTPYRSW